MRILLLNRYSLERTTGGVAEFLHYLPLVLKSHGIHTVAYNEDESHSGKLQGPHYSQNGLVAYAGPFIKPGFFVSSKKLKPLLDLCRSEKIDLIHAQGAYRCGFIALQVFKRIGIPYIVTSHADIVATNSDRMKRKKVQRRCRDALKYAAGVSHLTPRMAEISHEICDTRFKNTIIGNGIDLAGWQSVLSLPEKKYVLGIGRLEPEKGFHVLIDAFARLMQRGVDTSLVIAGSGSAELALQVRARNLGLRVITEAKEFSSLPEQSVIFTGYIRGDLKKQLMAQCQCVLFPTQPSQWEEPFGIVQIEAMAAGKALVASDSATTRYLQTFGLQALLVKPDDADDWAGQIQMLLSDVNLRHEFAKANLSHANQFDWGVVAAQYAKMYANTLGADDI